MRSFQRSETERAPLASPVLSKPNTPAMYVDDIIVYSNTCDEHIKHLVAVLGKLTTAGFTINIGKCDFCKLEIKF